MALIFPSLTATGQIKDIKIWDNTKLITWEDFKGAVDSTKNFDALTTSGDTVFYNWNRNNGNLSITFRGYAFMNRNASWVKTGKQSQALLRHEQLHFDISEYFFKKFIFLLENYHFTNDFKNEIALINNYISKTRLTMQDNYDKQTQHSRNVTMQKIWDEYITNLLMNDYPINVALIKEPTY